MLALDCGMITSTFDATWFKVAIVSVCPYLWQHIVQCPFYAWAVRILFCTVVNIQLHICSYCLGLVLAPQKHGKWKFDFVLFDIAYIWHRVSLFFDFSFNFFWIDWVVHIF
jgi:hypothetical protein